MAVDGPSHARPEELDIPSRDMITGRTIILGIIADPVAQARTPALLNAALAVR